MTEGDDDAYQMPDPQERGASWRDQPLVDAIRAVAEGTWTRPVPTVGAIEGTDRGLFYPGKVNGIHGIAGVGKSLLLALAEVQELAARNHVVHVDLEDDEYTLVQRLLDMGAKPEDIETRLHYKRPTEHSSTGITYLHDTITEHHPTLVVIDSTGESMAMDGVKANEDDDVARWLRRVARAAADLGPAVVTLDHVPKAAEDALMSIGSQRKSAGVNGAIYSMQGEKPFSRGQSGFVRLVCGKDRGGNYAKGTTVAEFHHDADENEFTLREPNEATRVSDDKTRDIGLMVKVSRWALANGPVSKSQIYAGVGGNKARVLRAIDALIFDGYITTAVGVRNAVLCTVVKPYWGDKQ